MRKCRGAEVRLPEPGKHPLTTEMFSLRMQKGVTFEQLAKQAGVSRATILSWGHRHIPRIDAMQAVLGALGYQLTITRQLPRRHYETMTD